MGDKKEGVRELARQRRNARESTATVEWVPQDWREQCKRPDQGIWKWAARIYIPCPLRVKIEFTRIARANSMSQAELGLLIVSDALLKPEVTQDVINDYREAGKEFDRNGQNR